VTTCIIMMQDQVVSLLFYIDYDPSNAVKPYCETQSSCLANCGHVLSSVFDGGLPPYSSFSSDARSFLNQFVESYALDSCKSFISINHMGGLQDCLLSIWPVCNRTCLFNDCSDRDIVATTYDTCTSQPAAQH